MPGVQVQGFWSATPVEASAAAAKRYYIRMRISLSEEEYNKKSEPYYVRVMTRAGKMAHVPIDMYRYTDDCTLETRFYFDEPDAFPVQTPMVCFDRDDCGEDAEEDDKFCISRPLELYSRLYAGAAVVRDRLESKFPDCRPTEVGFMGNDLMLFLRLRGNFMVAASSDTSVPLFTWDRRFLVPLDTARPVLGHGFKLTLPTTNGAAEQFWYERDRVQLFSSINQVVRYADAHVYKTGEVRIDPKRHLLSASIVHASDTLPAQLRRLARAVPYLKVATYSRVPHAIKVFVDMQWRCEVRGLDLVFFYSPFSLQHPLQVTLHVNGTWRVASMDPDPIVGSCDRGYLDALEDRVRRALTRVCVVCKGVGPAKLRCCPCREVHYCGKECQKAHWAEHKLVCGSRC